MWVASSCPTSEPIGHIEEYHVSSTALSSLSAIQNQPETAVRGHAPASAPAIVQ
jgi:hypothetical protein